MFSFCNLTSNDIFVDVKAEDFKSILFHIIKYSRIPRKKEVFKAVTDRENLGTTAIGHNVAIPHCRLDNFSGFYIKVAVFKEHLGYIAPTGDEIRFMFLVIGPENGIAHYLKALSHISRVMNKSALRKDLLNVRTKAQIKNILCKYENEMLKEEALERKTATWK